MFGFTDIRYLVVGRSRNVFVCSENCYGVVGALETTNCYCLYNNKHQSWCISATFDVK